MKKAPEVLLTLVALAGLYSAVAANASQPSHSTVQAEQVVVAADGSDPMPLCRGKHCR